MEIREEFNKRTTEIDIYFDILKAIELDKPRLSFFDVAKGERQEIIFDLQRINIFRASAFLLLYNLVESTVFNSVVAIFDAINSEKHNPKLKFFDVIDDVKKYWLNNIYQHDEKIKKETVINAYLKISNRIFEESLLLATNYIKFGGSLDARRIKETAELLGIDTSAMESGFRKDTHGEALNDVKQKRNWLAHGEKTFFEIGQDYPCSRLEEWRTYTREHLEKFICSVEDYILNEKYKSVVVSINHSL